MVKQIAVNVGDGAAQNRTVTLTEGDKYFFGNVSTASDDFDAIMSTNSSYQSMIELFREAVNGNVEGVAVTGLDCDGYTLEITNDGGVVDTLNVLVDDWSALDKTWFGGNVGDNREDFNVVSAKGNGTVDKIIGTSKNYFDEKLGATVGGIKDLVGGSAKGENDYQALLEAALDESDHRVTLLDIGSDNFSIQIHRNDVTDTFLVKDAGDIIADVFGSSNLVNPGNSTDQFVFVPLGSPDGMQIGFGASGVDNPGEPQFNSNIKVGQLADIVANADDWADVQVTELGGLIQVALTDDSTDVITFDADLIL